MATDVTMPRLSDSMEEGTILKWIVEKGGEVKRGEPLVEIETDKANMTYEADTDGTLIEVIAGEGDTLAVGEVIGRIGDASEAGETADSEQRTGAKEDAEEASGDGAEEKETVEASKNGDEAEEEAKPKQKAESSNGAGDGERVKASPVARRMAESKATAPDFELDIEVDMTMCVELRSRLKELAEHPPSYNDMVVKACGSALREFPRVNGAYRDGKFELYSRVNIGVAVAARDALVVPTINDVDKKSLGEVSRQARALIDKVKDGSITPPELSGGTFTVSNLGMFGIEQFTAIINPPQAAILTVGKLEK